MEDVSKINQINLKDRVLAYESKILNSTMEEMVNDTPLMIKFRGIRRPKLVAIVADKLVMDVLKSINELALLKVETDTTLSDNIEVFTLSVISDSQRSELNAMFLKSGLSLTLTDRMQMEGIDEFKSLFKSFKETNFDFDSSLYEYLSMSNDAMDVKNSLFYALLLVMIYQNQPLKQDVLERMMHEKYGKNVGDVPMAIKSLCRQKKIEKECGGTICLTEEEKTRLEQSLKEEKVLEEEFKEQYEIIINKYGLDKGEHVLELLREAYQTQYRWHSQSDDDAEKKERLDRENLEKIIKFVEAQIGDIHTHSFISEIKSLCEKNDYLSRYSLSHSFLQLYRSSSYEEYINNKESFIILDTMVLTGYVCYLSGLEEQYESEWNNAEYQSVKALSGQKEKSKGKVCFYVPYDYLQETVGELKKALQFSWFDKIELPIPFETGNTFYNFYLFVRDCMKESGQNVRGMTFQKFVSDLGFDVLDPENSQFKKRALTYLKYFLEKNGCSIIEPIKEHYDTFERLKVKYEINHIFSKKTTSAVNCDVRQALYLVNETIAEDNSDINYFLATWDNSLVDLRNYVNEEMDLTSSYSVMNPSNLANKLAFKNFTLGGKNVSEDVFAYANNYYNLEAKVQSLYDNILIPFFANANNHNAALVSTILKMEKDCLDADRDDYLRPNRQSTTLEDVFTSIVFDLPKNNLSTQNLREFLADETNNDFVIELMKSVFDHYSKGQIKSISERFCERMKEKMSKNSEELKL